MYFFRLWSCTFLSSLHFCWVGRAEGEPFMVEFIYFDFVPWKLETLGEYGGFWSLEFWLAPTEWSIPLYFWLISDDKTAVGLLPLQGLIMLPQYMLSDISSSLVGVHMLLASMICMFLICKLWDYQFILVFINDIWSIFTCVNIIWVGDCIDGMVKTYPTRRDTNSTSWTCRCYSWRELVHCWWWWQQEWYAPVFFVFHSFLRSFLVLPSVDQPW